MADGAAGIRSNASVEAESPYVERARGLSTVLDSAAEDIDQTRELPAQVLDAMHARGLFRLSLPRFLNGAELPPAALAAVTEAVAMSDASAAWCLGQALGCAMSAAFMEQTFAQRVFGPSDAVLAWGAGVQGEAVAVDGGYKVCGKWGFASGGKHATWLGGHCKVYEADGSPRLAADGTQANRTALFPRDVATVADDWYVMGLRGTRSEGYAVSDLFVEQGLTLDRDTPEECQHRTTLYRFTTTNVYASVFSGVALGIARRMLDDLLTLATRKTPRGARSSMRESAVVQTRLAQLSAQLGAARAYQQETLRDVWREVDAGRTLTMEDRAAMRLATTYAIDQATDVVEQVYRMAGATAIFESQPFERRFRDAHAVSQQVQGRFTNFETVGRFMLGLDVETMFM